MSLSTPRRRALLKGLASTLLPAPLLLHAQDKFPNKPLRFIVPLPASGAADVSVRLLAETMQGPLGQTINVDNRPGGAYMLGMQQILAAPADGHTLIHLNSTMCAVQASLKRFDILKQLVPVAYFGSTDALLIAAPNAPFKTAQEMVAWAKANPGKLSYGSSGIGTMEHLLMVTLGNRQGFTANHIPFKGGPDAALAAAQGELHVVPVAAPLLVSFAGKVRTLASMADKRHPLAPDAPTLRESGIDLPFLTYWGGFAAPAGTPKAALDVLEKAIATAVDNPALKQRYTPLGLVPQFRSGDELARIIDADLKWQTDAIKAANLTFN